MTGTGIRAVEIEAYQRSRTSLADLLDGLADAAPRAAARVLHEHQPPSVLSPYDPVIGRYAWTAITARDDAGHDYYIPKIARPTAQAVARTYGCDSVVYLETVGILCGARERRAPRLRGAIDRACRRVARRRARLGPTHPRTLLASRRARLLNLRACRFESAALEFETTLDALRHEGAVWQVLFELQDLADDHDELGLLDTAVAAAERARAWAAGDALPAEHRAEARLHADFRLVEHCLSAAQVRRAGEVAAAVDARVHDAGREFDPLEASAAQHALGRVALLRREHRTAATHLRRSLDHEAEAGRAGAVARSVRRDLLFALAAPPGDTRSGSGS